MQLIKWDQQHWNKELWDSFVLSSPQGSMYSTADYLRCIAPDCEGWIVLDGEKWMAIMPFFPGKKWGLSTCFMPAFCQFQGVLFGKSESSEYRKTTEHYQILDVILKSMEHVQWFDMQFHTSFNALLPFIWGKYQIIPRITYHLNLKDEHNAYSNRHHRSLKKPDTQSFELKVNPSSDIFIRHLQKHLQSKELGKSHSVDKVRCLIQHVKPELMDILECWSGDEWLSGMLVLKYKGVCTYYLGTSSALGKSKQAMTWLMDQAIQRARSEGFEVFDFEGSVLPGVEEFFRGFGGTPKVYYKMRKRRILGLSI